MIVPRALVLAVIGCFAGALGCAGASSSTRTPTPDPLADVEADELYGHGLGMAERGDLVRAEQYILAAIEKGFDRGEALPSLLRVCIASQRYAIALRHANPYLQEHPEDWALRYLVATLHLAIGSEERARTELEKVIRDAPEQAVPYYTLGMLHHERHADMGAARQYFERYMELAPRGAHVEEVRDLLRPPIQRVERLDDHVTIDRSLESDEPGSPGAEASNSEGGV